MVCVGRPCVAVRGDARRSGIGSVVCVGTQCGALLSSAGRVLSAVWCAGVRMALRSSALLSNECKR